MKTIKNKKTAVVDDVVQLVTFQVGAEEYGLDIHVITEIVRPLKVTTLPRMPKFVEGVVNLRGIIIPLVDLRKRFGLTDIHDDPRKMRILVTKGAVQQRRGGGPELLGLVVDVVNEVVHLQKRDIDAAPAAATGEQVDFISGVGKVGDRLIILLDLTKILSQQERSALAEAGDAA